MNGANQTVSGGIFGFLAFFVLALALWFLVRNMNTRLRNLSYREEAEQAAAAARAERAASAAAPPSGGSAASAPPNASLASPDSTRPSSAG